MKKLVKSLLVVGASMVAANSAVASMVDDFCPYVGIDYKQRWMNDRFNTGATTGNNRNSSFYGGTIYLGTRWDCFGLEVGLEGAGRNRRTVTVGAVTANYRTNLWGGYIDALAYAPVADCVELFGGFGVGVLSPRVSGTLVSPTTGALVGTSSSKAAAVARLRLGLNYMVSDCVGLRGALGWETTENLATGFGTISRFHPFGNSFTLQAGVFAKF